MSFRFTVLLVIAFLTLGLISDADAFDGNRKGFILGGGIGPGVTSYTQTVEMQTSEGFKVSLTSDRENKFGIQTDFRIGYAPSEYLQIYYVSKVSWFGWDDGLGGTVSVAHGIGGVGVTYYLQPVAPSFFFTGTIGLSTWAAPFESDYDTWFGFGFSGGVGYEFVPHWGAELSVSYGKPGDSEFGLDGFFNALTVTACVNALAY